MNAMQTIPPMQSITIFSETEQNIEIKDKAGNVRGVLTFDPADSVQAEKIYSALGDIQHEFERVGEIEDASPHQDGKVIFTAKILVERSKASEFTREKLDYCFGPGTAQMLFGDSRNAAMLMQFMEQLGRIFDGIRKAAQAEFIAPAE
jgi:hypothetical protein